MHDLLVDERALRPQAVRAAHVAVVGREDHDRVVPRARRPRARASTVPSDSSAIRCSFDVVVEVPAATPSCRTGRCSPRCRAAGPSATAGARRACRAGRRRSSAGSVVDDCVVVAVERRQRSSSSFHCDALEQRSRASSTRVRDAVARYDGWSIGNHITSCGFTSATVRNHGSSRDAALARNQPPRESAMTGSKCDAGAGPAHEVAVVALPVAEAVRLHGGSGPTVRCHLPM